MGSLYCLKQLLSPVNYQLKSKLIENISPVGFPELFLQVILNNSFNHFINFKIFSFHQQIGVTIVTK